MVQRQEHELDQGYLLGPFMFRKETIPVLITKCKKHGITKTRSQIRNKQQKLLIPKYKPEKLTMRIKYKNDIKK